MAVGSGNGGRMVFGSGEKGGRIKGKGRRKESEERERERKRKNEKFQVKSRLYSASGFS